MMGALFQEQGATLRIEILEDPAVQDFIGTHAGILDSAFQEERMSDSLRDRLSETDWMFSGYKAFHELNEAFPSLVDESGARKPFDRFLKDVQSIDETYNRNWLRAEYNFAGASAQMAAKWERYAEDGDDYYLQYRTANDGAVRPEHAALHGVTLPQSDTFWDTYYPPNGWNCRCTVVQVRKSKYEQTPHDEAMAKGAAALAKDTKGMFRFNPGKQKSAFPAYNPYTISKCRTCDKSQFRLAANIPSNQLCEACVYLQTNVCGYKDIPTTRGRVREHYSQSPDEKKENRSIAEYLANKYGYYIDLIPKVDSVKGKKNPDSYNHTLGYLQEYKVNKTPTYNALDMALKKGFKQADSLILRLDSEITDGVIVRALKNRFNMYEHAKDIMLIKGEKDVVYTRDTILSADFKIQQEDFK
ncbi:MAG: minor capsid protein [Bacteroidales bacterium]|nr:minor capsid protein [Bacteroidales bacterium]